MNDGLFLLYYDVPDKTYLENEFAKYISFPSLKRDTIVTRNYHLPKMNATIHFQLTNPEALGPEDRLFCHIVYEYDDLDHNEIYGYGALNPPDLIESTYTTASFGAPRHSSTQIFMRAQPALSHSHPPPASTYTKVSVDTVGGQSRSLTLAPLSILSYSWD